MHIYTYAAVLSPAGGHLRQGPWAPLKCPRLRGGEGVGSGLLPRATDLGFGGGFAGAPAWTHGSGMFAGSRLCLHSVPLEAPLDCVPPKAGATVGAYRPCTGPGALPELIRYLLSEGWTDHKDSGTG